MNVYETVTDLKSACKSQSNFYTSDAKQTVFVQKEQPCTIFTFFPKNL